MTPTAILPPAELPPDPFPGDVFPISPRLSPSRARRSTPVAVPPLEPEPPHPRRSDDARQGTPPDPSSAPE